jgi:predicted nucleic acid-binding protein
LIVIADTSPINYLVLIDEIDVLPKIYGGILIPQAVFDELLDSASARKVREWLSARPDWLRISDAVFASDPLLGILDRGERDAILLAESIRAERLIMDDSDGRREAENRQLAVIGTLGVLAEAARRDLLDLNRALADLRQTNFFVAPALIEMLLTNEAKRRKR